MMTILTAVLALSMALFIWSLIASIKQGERTYKTYERIIAETLDNEVKTPVSASFVRAARRPTRVLGTFIF